MIGLTPRFSSAFSEQIHSDLDCSAFTKDFNGVHKMNQKNKNLLGTLKNQKMKIPKKLILQMLTKIG
jgi:hypothetical protein